VCLLDRLIDLPDVIEELNRLRVLALKEDVELLKPAL
jgi:hypothetical protein